MPPESVGMLPAGPPPPGTTVAVLVGTPAGVLVTVAVGLGVAVIVGVSVGVRVGPPGVIVSVGV